MLWKTAALFCLSLILASGNTFAQEVPNDLESKVILQLFQKHNKSFLCLEQDSSLPIVREYVDAQLRRMPSGSAQSQDVIATIVYTQFPCPFTPYRNGVRPVVSKDLIGAWLFPENSQKLRFGPEAPMWKKRIGTPIKCEVVAYYENGEARTATFGGTNPCPFKAARDIDTLHRGSPKVESWSLLRNGRVKFNHSDLPGHLEEWDVFVVDLPFRAGPIMFNTGDLLAYLRLESGNQYNVATTFRHLQRLQ